MVCAVAFENGDANTPWAVKLPLAWILSGPLPASEKVKCYAVCSMRENEELTSVVKQWCDLESHGTVASMDNRSSGDKQAFSHLNNNFQKYYSVQGW